MTTTRALDTRALRRELIDRRQSRDAYRQQGCLFAPYWAEVTRIEELEALLGESEDDLENPGHHLLIRGPGDQSLNVSHHEAPVQSMHDSGPLFLILISQASKWYNE